MTDPPTARATPDRAGDGPARPGRATAAVGQDRQDAARDAGDEQPAAPDDGEQHTTAETTDGGTDPAEPDLTPETRATEVLDPRTAETRRLDADTLALAARAHHGESVGTVVIEDGVIPRRVRRPFDLVRMLSALLLITVIVTLTLFLTATSTGVQDDFSKAGAQLPGIVRWVVALIAGFGVIVLPIAIGINLLLRRLPRQLLDAIIAMLLAGVLAFGIGLLVQKFGSTQLLLALTGQTSRDDRVALDYLVCGLAAFITVARVLGRGAWGVFSVIVLAAIGIAPAAAGSASVATMALSLLFGWAVGLLLRYLLGTPTTRPTGWEVAATLDGAGWPLAVLRASKETRRGRAYLATTTTGHVLRVKVLDRDREGAGLLSAGWRLLRLREDTAAGPGFSMRGALNHAALMSYAAQAGGAPSPQLRLVSAVGPDSALLAYDHIEGARFADLGPDEVTDRDLVSAFQAVRELHSDRLAHRALTATELIRGTDGRVWLTGIDNGVVAATDVQERIDVAELLCTLGLIVGPERTLAAGRRVLGAARLTYALPAMQPVAMSADTRRAMRGNKKLLVSLRNGLIELQPSGGPVEQLELRRIKARTIITLILGTFAAYVLVGQLTSYNLIDLFRAANWSWVLLAAVLSFLSFVGAALSLSGFVPERLSHVRTLAAQLAAGFATLVSPPTVGAVAVNVRYLQKSGLHPALASASVGVSQVFAFGLHLLLLLGFGIAAGQSQHLDFEPPLWAIIAVGVILVLAAVAFAFGPVRRLVTERLGPILAEVGPRLITLAQRPWKIAEGMGGILLLNGAFCMCMIACVAAFDGGGNLAAIAIVYLAGSTLGQAAPTPGGIGAVEAVYVAGLTAAGVDPAVSLSATFLFRLLTFYLPTLPGYLCFNWLQRVGSL